MKTPFLRKFRILFSAVVFICFFLVFVDLKNLIPVNYINILLSLQFIPSLLKFFDLRTFITAGFIAVLILTLLTGRTYSWNRPGFFQQDRRPDKKKIQEIRL